MATKKTKRVIITFDIETKETNFYIVENNEIRDIEGNVSYECANRGIDKTDDDVVNLFVNGMVPSIRILVFEAKDAALYDGLFGRIKD